MNWRQLLALVACVSLIVITGSAALPAGRCRDVLDVAMWQTPDEGWTWTPLGLVSDGSTAFLIRRDDGLWQVATVAGNLACLVLNGRPL